MNNQQANCIIRSKVNNRSLIIREMTSVSAVIPARNERERIAQVIKETRGLVDEVIVVDDGSSDGTGRIARELGARVIANEHGRGYVAALKTGFENAQGDLVVTLDADGEHVPRDIPRLIQPILDGKADLVFGKREEIPRFSERLICGLARLKVRVRDSGSGFRALRRELALKLSLRGRCTCGIFALEAKHYGAKISEEPVTIRPIPKKRRIMWGHFWQIFYVLRWLLTRDIEQKLEGKS